MVINVNLNFGTLLQWLTAIGTVGAVIFSLYQANQDRKKEKDRQRINLESQKNQVEKIISMLENFQKELRANKKKLDSVSVKGYGQESVIDPREKLYYSENFLEMVSRILTEYYCYDEQVEVDLLKGKIFEDHNNNINRDWEGYAKAMESPLKKLREIKNNLESKIRTYKE